MRKPIVKLLPVIFSVFLFCIFFLNTAQAQIKTCDVQFEVFQSPEEGSSEVVKVDNVKAVLTRLDNYKRKNADQSNGALRFLSLEDFPSDLTQATYRLTLKKDGYKTTYKSFRLDCIRANEKNLVSKTVFLFKGNSKEKVHLIDEELKSIPEIGRVDDNDLALKLVQPNYPPAAKAVHASGAILVVIGINEQGEVVVAEPVQGNSLFFASVVEAAKKSKFVPTLAGNKPTKVKAIIVYNFVAQ